MLVLVGTLSLPLFTQAEMFKCTAASGATVYQDKPCATAGESQKTIATPADKDEADPIAASLKVYLTGYILEKMERWCAEKSPSSSPAIRKAGAAWIQRHDALMRTAEQTLQSKYSNSQRIEINARAARENEALISKIEPAGQAEHQKWCDGLPAKMFDPQFNLIAHPRLVKTVMGNVAR